MLGCLYRLPEVPPSHFSYGSKRGLDQCGPRQARKSTNQPVKTLRLNLFNCLSIKSMFHCSDSIVYLEKIDQSYDFRKKKGRSCRPIHKKLIDAKS